MLPQPIIFSMMMTLQIATLNVQGMTSALKRQRTADWMIRNRIDILCLQETYATPANSNWKSEFPQHMIFHAYGTNHSRGVSIIARPIPQLHCIKGLEDPNGRYLSVKVSYCSVTFDLLTLYAPTSPTDRRAFYQNMTTYLQNPTQLIVCGDFNSVFNPSKDKLSQARLSPRSSDTATLQNFLSDLNLIDVYRQRHPDTAGYTWTRVNPPVACRLDMFLISSVLEHQAREIEITPAVLSDHCSVFLRMQFPSTQSRGRGYWKFNKCLLSEARFRRQVIAFWLHWQYQKPRFISLLAWWDAGKAHIKSMSIRYGIDRQRKLHKIRTRLEQSLQKAQRDIQTGQYTAIARADFFRKRLHEYEREQIQGQQVRCRVQWIESGESSGKFFTAKENIKGARDHITELKYRGKTATDTNACLRLTKEFYADLYREQPIDDEASAKVLSSLEKKLTPTDSTFCEGPLTLEECTESLKQLHADKSPGIDGLTAEFYRAFWPTFSQDFIEMANEVYQSSCLSSTQRTGIIRIIYKKGARDDLSNWRPISLLNTDYKIMTKALTNRVKKVIASIIHPDQTCSVPHRTIHDNCATIRDVFHQFSDENAAVISLDQSKAFDRVNRNHLSRVLRAFGFGPSFRRWIDTLYFNICSHIIVNGSLSSRVDIHSGVRQGCPLSPLLYILSLEPLASAIRKNTSIQGATTFNDPHREHIKLSVYADDITVFLTTEASFHALNDELEIYQSASNARLNRDKSVGKWLGKWKRQENPLQIQWSTTQIKILGLLFSPSYYDDMTENWAIVLQRLRKTLAVWQRRDLSYLGRAKVLSTYALSKIYYIAHTFTMPRLTMQQFQDVIWDFLWKNTPPLVKKSVCVSRQREGGLGMPHLQSRLAAIHLQTIRRLFDNTNGGAWKSLASQQISHLSGQYNMGNAVFAASGWTPDYRNKAKLSPFYRYITTAWRQYDGGRDLTPPQSYHDAIQEPLWGNRLVCSTLHRPLYYRSMARCGFYSVEDIWNKSPPRRRTIASQVYHHVLQAIPQSWVSLPRQGFSTMAHWQTRLCFFSTSDKPLFLPEASTRSLYLRLLSKHTEIPTCQEKWEQSYGHINPEQWHTLWTLPERIAPVQLDITWKFLHRVLPTNATLFHAKISPSDQCPSCHRPNDTVDHAFHTCPIWNEVLRSSIRFLHSLHITPPPPQHSHPLELLQTPGNLKPYFVLLLTTFWMKRTTPTKVIMNYFKWTLRRYIRICWFKKTSLQTFQSFWSPFVAIINGNLYLHV